MPDGEDWGAEFSPCGLYRYRLWRRWSSAAPMCFVMLNPSTADESENDPTVERCYRRAKVADCGGVLVANLFAYRSTDPKPLRIVADPVGPLNDEAIMTSAREASVVVAAWGAQPHERARLRAKKVKQLLADAGLSLMCIGRPTKDGHPRHPLYLPYSAGLEKWV